MAAPRLMVQFSGPVSCQRDTHGPIGLTLRGGTASDTDEITNLAFGTPSAVDLARELDSPAVERLAPGCYRIRCASLEWTLSADACHLHHEISRAFHAALPPRAAPFGKRIFWRLVLALAGNPTGKRILLALRRR